jgi:hypothetical protein
LGIFFSIGLGIGGVISPLIFSLLIESNDRSILSIGYYLGKKIKNLKKN